MNTKFILNRIKKERRKRSWKQDVIAAKLGISQVAYSRLETGKTQISLKQVLRIAEIFEISASTLFLKEEDEIDYIRLHPDVNFQLVNERDKYQQWFRNAQEKLELYRKNDLNLQKLLETESWKVAALKQRITSIYEELKRIHEFQIRPIQDPSHLTKENLNKLGLAITAEQFKIQREVTLEFFKPFKKMMDQIRKDLENNKPLEYSLSLNISEVLNEIRRNNPIRFASMMNEL